MFQVMPFWSLIFREGADGNNLAGDEHSESDTLFPF